MALKPSVVILVFRILKRSHCLKLLDLRGWAGLNGDCLQSLPVSDLERLYISGCSLAKYEGIEIIMSKVNHCPWLHTLSWDRFIRLALIVSKEACCRLTYVLLLHQKFATHVFKIHLILRSFQIHKCS